MYHLNKSTQVVKCNKDNCKLTHYESYDEAQREANKIMMKEFNLIPDAVYESNIPNELTIEYLSEFDSELYVAVKALMDSTINPHIILGVTSHEEKIYHCVYEVDGMYHDINGVIGVNEEDLMNYMKDEYQIEELYTLVNTQKSINMIEDLLGFYLYETTTYDNIITRIENIHHKIPDSREAMSYLTKLLQKRS